MNIKGMDRRGFLGIFGGAAVAGPKLAVGIVNDMASAIPPAPYVLASTTGQAVQSGGSHRSRQRRQARLSGASVSNF